jgi:hypothetical protein
MPQQTFAARYRAAERLAGGRCPIEAGLICRLADHECRHGRLAFDRTAPCGCWHEEGAVVRPLPEASGSSTRRTRGRVAASQAGQGPRHYPQLAALAHRP